MFSCGNRRILWNVQCDQISLRKGKEKLFFLFVLFDIECLKRLFVLVISHFKRENFFVKIGVNFFSCSFQNVIRTRSSLATMEIAFLPLTNVIGLRTVKKEKMKNIAVSDYYFIYHPCWLLFWINFNLARKFIPSGSSIAPLSSMRYSIRQSS